MKRGLVLIALLALGLSSARADFFSTNATRLRGLPICSSFTPTDTYSLTWSSASGCIGWTNVSAGSGASTALSNLASVSINTSLLFQTGVDVGSAAAAARNIFLYGAGTFSSTSIKLTGTPTGNRVITFPDLTGTVVLASQIIPTSPNGSVTIGLTGTVAPTLDVSTTYLNAGWLPKSGGTLTGMLTVAAGASDPGIRTVCDTLPSSPLGGALMMDASCVFKWYDGAVNRTVVSTDGTQTLTGKTIDTEGTGNVVTVPDWAWLPGGGCQNTTAIGFWDLPTSTPAVAACVTGSNTQKGVLDFADTSGGFSAQNELMLPANFTGTVDADIYWFTTATSGNAKWSLSTVCTPVGATATDDPSYNTASTVTTAAPGTANRLQTSTITTLTITGCSASTKQFLHLKLFRDGNDGSDTLGATARFLGLGLTIRRAL